MRQCCASPAARAQEEVAEENLLVLQPLPSPQSRGREAAPLVHQKAAYSIANEESIPSHCYRCAFGVANVDECECFRLCRNYNSEKEPLTG